MKHNGLRPTARGIIVRGGQLLVFERFRLSAHGRNMHYYSIPGGGIDPGEAPEQAVVRELNEEMGVTVRVVRLLVRQTTAVSLHHYFLCDITGGEPTFQHSSPEAADVSHLNSYAATWLPLEKALHAHIFPDYRQALKCIMRKNLLDVPQPAIDTTFKRSYTKTSKLTSEE